MYGIFRPMYNRKNFVCAFFPYFVFTFFTMKSLEYRKRNTCVLFFMLSGKRRKNKCQNNVRFVGVKLEIEIFYEKK